MTPQVFVGLSIVTLALIALLVFVVGKGRRDKRLTPLSGLAFGFVLAGILIGDNRLIGYGLLVVGVILSLVDIYNRLRHR